MISTPTINTKYSSLIFLHLSDIHFSKGDSYDLDEDLRYQLEIDAKGVIKEVGKVDAILVTGDIAFSGASEEYLQAKTWLNNLKEIVKCEPPIILTVPGNHDVNQSIYANEKFLRSTLNTVTACSSDDEINSELKEIYASPSSESILYNPIQNYNVFASELGCELSHIKQFWNRDFLMQNGIKIYIRGLNSSLGSRRGDERMKNLFLGLKQLQIPTEPKTLNIILCHHPPDWLKDHDQIEDYLSDRVHIQLFGHKHTQRLTTINNKLRVTAGAVHPSRKENYWLPRYNFIEIAVSSHNSVKVKVYPRVWKDTKFVPEFFDNGEKYFEISFILENDEVEPIIDLMENVEEDPPVLIISDESEKLINETSIIVNEEINMSNSGVEYGKILVRRFLNLDEYSRDKIINELKLNNPPFEQLQTSEIFKEIFVRAKNREQLEELWDEVEKEHGDKIFSENPFKGS